MKKGDVFLPFYDEIEWINKSKGKIEFPCILLFWSISCSQCKSAIRRLQKIQSTYGNEISIISVHMPRSSYDNDVERVKSFVINNRIEMEVALDHQFKLSDHFQNYYVPTAYLFDETKRLITTASGQNCLNRIEKEIKEQLL